MTSSGSDDRLGALYLCYLGLGDPLVLTQVINYLEGLAKRGHVIHLLTFEPRRLSRAQRRQWRQDLGRRGIAWHTLRYHKRPSLLATALDMLRGAVYAALLIRRHRLGALHARSHVPAAMALIACRLTRARLIFDIRGLMAEEYEDAGRWARDSVTFRLTKWVERLGIARADGIVVLTERVRRHLFGEDAGAGASGEAIEASARTAAPSAGQRGPGQGVVRVIPCCADLERLEAMRSRRTLVRGKLGLDGGPVLTYVGKLTGWYMEREMAQFFACARESLPGLHFVVLTQSDPAPMILELERCGVHDHERTVTGCSPDELGGFLAATDAAISFIRPTFSKISTSPTKIGEYLGAGLPVVCGRGIGDVDELLEEYEVGVLLGDFSSQSLSDGARRLARCIGDPEHAARSRRAAKERLSLSRVGIPAYDRLYRHVASARELARAEPSAARAGAAR